MRLVKVYCGTCNAIFGGRLALKSHYRNSPGCSADDPFTEDIKYHCRLCNEQFDMKVRPFKKLLGQGIFCGGRELVSSVFCGVGRGATGILSFGLQITLSVGLNDGVDSSSPALFYYLRTMISKAMSGCRDPELKREY